MVQLEFPSMLIFHLSLWVRFFFKKTPEIYKIQNGKSQLQKCRKHFRAPSRMKNCSVKGLCIVPNGWKKWGAVPVWQASHSRTSCMQRMIRTEVNLQLNLVQLKPVFGRVMAGSNPGIFMKYLLESSSEQSAVFVLLPRGRRWN